MTKQATTLGAFSVSLAVKNLQASRAFYEKLDFEVFGGAPAQKWLILRNGMAMIGLFQGMVERNIPTFQPRLERQGPGGQVVHRCARAPAPPQVQGARSSRTRPTRAAQRPASFEVIDPDGNPVLIDQHV